MQKYFDPLHSVASDALDLFLADPPITSITDYWHTISSSRNPLASLAPMTIDFLSIPAASTDVEHAFSSGGLTVSDLRHSLSDESTRAATVLSSWAGVPGLISENDIVENIRMKRFRWAKDDQDLKD
jgi:hypothetical protein